jgi:hypothetical protein
MQRCAIFFALALWLAPAAALSVSAEGTAKMWMRSHQDPTQGQLGELASSNPQAFAIVSALLNKHHTNTLPESMRGPDVFKSMMGPHHMSAAETSVAMPYPDAVVPGGAPEPVVRDQAEDGATSAGGNDGPKDQVGGLLDMVSQLAGGSQAKQIALLRQKHQDAMEESQATVHKPKHDWSAGEEEQRKAAGWKPLTVGSAASMAASGAPEGMTAHSELEKLAPVLSKTSGPVTVDTSSTVTHQKTDLWSWLGNGLKQR